MLARILLFRTIPKFLSMSASISGSFSLGSDIGRHVDATDLVSPNGNLGTAVETHADQLSADPVEETLLRDLRDPMDLGPIERPLCTCPDCRS